MYSTRITKHDFADLYTELAGYFDDKTDRTVMFVGAHPRTGTSLIAGHFALIAAEQEQGPVLLVDLGGPRNVQLTRFQQHHRDPLDADPDEVDPDRLPRQGPWIRHGDNGSGRVPAFRCHWFRRYNLAVSGCYGVDEQPTLDIPSMESFWQELHQFFKLIVIDCPPRSAGVECNALAPHVDATVLVISAEDTRVPVAAHLRDELVAGGAHIPGVVFNKRRFYIPQFIYNRMGA